MAYRVGVDIGGTFADFCLLDEATGSLSTLKVLSTPATPGTEVIAGLHGPEQRFGVGPTQIAWFTHGTTVGVNAVIQRKGIPLALFVTRNSRDVLELARLKTPDPYHLLPRRPAPLVPRERAEFEQVWTPGNYAALTEALAAMPVHWRLFAKRRIFAAVAADPARRGDGTEVRAALAALRTEFPQIT